MATLVCFHAHPDDEAIATGGSMALAASQGHRVVLVLATRGEHGEVAEGFLDPGETLAQRRTRELEESCRLLGVARLEFLGYVDSGMAGTAENDLAETFWQADTDEAARQLAALLIDEQADALTIYDDHGNYGHPDHIKVHHVGVRAAEMAGTARVYEATMNRDAMRANMSAVRQAQLAAEAEGEPLDMPGDSGDDGFDVETFGTPEAEITTAIDVRSVLDVKRAALIAHASQIGPDSFFVKMPPDQFGLAFGTEWFVRRGGAKVPSGAWETALVDDSRERERER